MSTHVQSLVVMMVMIVPQEKLMTQVVTVQTVYSKMQTEIMCVMRMIFVRMETTILIPMVMVYLMHVKLPPADKRTHSRSLLSMML